MSMVPGEGQGLLRFLCRLLSISVIVYGQDQSHDQCGVANSDSYKETGASLLQTKSDRSHQPSATQAGLVSESKLTKQPGSVIALLSLAGAIQNQNGAQSLLSANMLGEAEGQSPSLYLVILAIVVAGCIFLGVVHVLNDPNSEKREFGAPQSNGFRVGAGAGQSSKDVSRAPSVRDTPLNSSRAVPSPRLPADRSPGQPETLPSPSAGRHLCPGLVVPHGNECILAVPALPTSGPDMAALTVQDLDGKSVIQAEVAMPTMARAAGGGRPIIVLRAGSAPRVTSGQAQPLLAYCKASTEAGNRKSVFIYDARDELFSQIAKDPANPRRFVLTSGRVSLQLCFEGDIEKHAVTVTNEQNQVVAETMPAVMAFNPAGVYYKLRVVSNVDVGLMLCALFAIDCLELS